MDYFQLAIEICVDSRKIVKEERDRMEREEADNFNPGEDDYRDECKHYAEQDRIAQGLDSNGEEIDPMSPLGEYTFNLAKSLNAVFVAGMNAEREGR